MHLKGLPIVSIVVPFWGYLIGSLIYSWLNQKGTTMEIIGRVYGLKSRTQETLVAAG